jgi:hypothetical protein
MLPFDRLADVYSSTLAPFLSSISLPPHIFLSISSFVACDTSGERFLSTLTDEAKFGA